MKFIIGTIIFWVTIIGLRKLLIEKSGINKDFALPMVFTLLGIIMFISGILNFMKIISLLIILLGASSFCYFFIKEDKKQEKILSLLKNPVNIIIVVIFLYITLLGYNMHLTDYDNFSHWGLIIKNMFMTNHLPNFENDVILFKGYQPGSACFIYFYGLLTGKTEGTMIIAQNYLIFSYLVPLIHIIKKKNKVVNYLAIICFYIFIMTISIRFNSLLVDSLIAVITIYSLMIINYYKKDLKKAYLYSLPVSVFVLLVKNTGLILAGISCLYLLMIGIKNKQIKEGFKYCLYTLIILGVTLLVWQKHVSLVYGYLALNSKHSLSTSNIITSMKTMGIDHILLFIKMYAKHLFSFKHNISNIYIILINIILVIVSICSKDKKKVYNLIKIVDIIYLGYYIVLGMMYILSMPWEEAKVFASYERYMTTINIIIIGIVFIYLFKNNDKINKYSLIMLLISVALLIPIYFYRSNFKSLLGKDNYKNSNVEKWDKLIKDVPINYEAQYYIYAPSTLGDYGFFYHLSAYKLNTNKIIILNGKNSIEDNKINYVVMFEENNSLRESITQQGYKKYNNLIYIKSN